MSGSRRETSPAPLREKQVCFLLEGRSYFLQRVAKMSSLAYVFLTGRDRWTGTSRFTFTKATPVPTKRGAGVGTRNSTPGGGRPARITAVQFPAVHRHSPPQSSECGIQVAGHKTESHGAASAFRTHSFAWQQVEGLQSWSTWQLPEDTNRADVRRHHNVTVTAQPDNAIY